MTDLAGKFEIAQQWLRHYPETVAKRIDQALRAMDEVDVTQIEHRRHDEVHNCVRPDCWQRAQTAYAVTQQLRLAGFTFEPGEFVDLCAAHSNELRDVLREAWSLGFTGDAERDRILTDELEIVNPVDRLREWSP